MLFKYFVALFLCCVMVNLLWTTSSSSMMIQTSQVHHTSQSYDLLLFLSWSQVCQLLQLSPLFFHVRLARLHQQLRSQCFKRGLPSQVELGRQRPDVQILFHRFVYYETLVTTLKQLGVMNDIVEFDALKREKQKQTLYGLIETASLLCAGTF